MKEITITATRCNERVEIITTEDLLQPVLAALTYDGFRGFVVK